MNAEGSIQAITEIPAAVREIYLTVWEMKQTEIMRRAALRSAFVDQSQSLNIHIRDNSNATLRGVMFTGWNLGLKTGSYYIRTRAAADAIKNNIAAGATVTPRLTPMANPTNARTLQDAHTSRDLPNRDLPNRVHTPRYKMITDALGVGSSSESGEDTVNTDGAVCVMDEGCVHCSS
jgi:ribonucleotide reductase alpha subunit